ncbi:unnamed protein product [Lactuca saligna]|uniref:Uncharacterized protein n=1 Tax=Lactuca saligna TaxID=75948 RepID=A0AA35ZL56_LACSI|nr:unnamed protein product [Lactuca saligna]
MCRNPRGSGKKPLEFNPNSHLWLTHLRKGVQLLFKGHLCYLMVEFLIPILIPTTNNSSFICSERILVTERHYMASSSCSWSNSQVFRKFPSNASKKPLQEHSIRGALVIELMIAAGKVVPILQLEHGVAVVTVHAGSFMTSLDIGGFSIIYN